MNLREHGVYGPGWVNLSLEEKREWRRKAIGLLGNIPKEMKEDKMDDKRDAAKQILEQNNPELRNKTRVLSRITRLIRQTFDHTGDFYLSNETVAPGVTPGNVLHVNDAMTDSMIEISILVR